MNRHAPRVKVIRAYRSEHTAFEARMYLVCGHEKMWYSDVKVPASTLCYKCGKKQNAGAA